MLLSDPICGSFVFFRVVFINAPPTIKIKIVRVCRLQRPKDLNVGGKSAKPKFTMRLLALILFSVGVRFIILKV